jgi:CheY-like chemotaxis protein
MESSTRKTRRVVIVDDSRTAQAIVETAFEDKRDFTVVGVASDAAEGVRLVRQLAPDLVTIDLCMPYLDGSALLEMLSDMRNVCKVIVSESFSNNIAMVSRLEALGASLCLRKTDLKLNPVTFFNKISAALDRHDASVLRTRPWERPFETFQPPSAVTTQPPFFGFPVPSDEEARIRLVKSKRLDDAVREQQFDLITEHVAEVTGFPVCLLNFIDRDTQWIKSGYGYDRGEMPRHHAFCSHTIADGNTLLVSNAATDHRFRTNPIVIGEPGVRTYVGHPIETADGTRIGALCVLDTKVRPVGPNVTRHLARVAKIIGAIVDDRLPIAA